tara:strand:- start:4617 stop:5087 length:471 start_codon:yes stop_codon:yes gene_type:complete
MYSAMQKLRENPETINAGQRWTNEDDKKLMEMIDNNIITKNTIDYHTISSAFKRTTGSIKARIQLNVYNMIDETNTIESLCNKYHLEVSEMNIFVDKQKSKKEYKQPENKSTKITIDDVYKMLISYRNDFDEIKQSIKKINKKLKKLEIYDENEDI